MYNKKGIVFTIYFQYTKNLFLKVRIKKLDALYHFDEKPIENETKDSK